jgi:hypothetical protein
MALFGTDRPVEAGRLHGDIEAGTARLLQTPRMTHAWLHHSPTAIGAALDWFDRTLTGQRRLPPADQVWPRKEIGTALALAGIAPFVIGLFGMFARRALPGAQPRFAADPAGPAKPVARRVTLWALLLIPVVSYLPLMRLAESLIGENPVFRQTFSNQIVFWLTCNALLAWVASLLPGMPRPHGARVPLLRAAIVATLAAAALHLVISLADGLGHVSPQFWIAIWRPLTWARLQDFFAYLPMVLFYFAVALRAIDGVYPLNAGGAGRAFAITAGIMAGPFVVFLAAQYGTLLATGTLLFPTEGLRVIISILFVPLMALAAGIGVAACRRTGDTLPGALLAGILVTWFLVATQPMGAD